MNYYVVSGIYNEKLYYVSDLDFYKTKVEVTGKREKAHEFEDLTEAATCAKLLNKAQYIHVNINTIQKEKKISMKEPVWF